MNCLLPAHNLKILVKAIQALSRLPGEDLYVEASADGLSLRTVNSSRSGYMNFLFKPNFFSHWAPAIEQDNTSDGSQRPEDEEKTNGNFCKISMKSALIVYKAVASLEKSIESCSISVDVDDWRLVFELQCAFKVIRKYKLVLLNCMTMRVLFNKQAMRNSILMSGKLLLDGVQQNFHSGQDEVTLAVDSDGLDFRNHVEDTKDAEKILKTQVHLDRAEFDQFNVQPAAEVTFCLKELRALLTFVEAFELLLALRFDQPGQHIIFSVESDPAFTVDLVMTTFTEANETQQQESQPVALQQPAEVLQEQAQSQEQTPPKRSRPDLFRGWSQRSVISASQYPMSQDDEGAPSKVILAPDSDLEDY